MPMQTGYYTHNTCTILTMACKYLEPKILGKCENRTKTDPFHKHQLKFPVHSYFKGFGVRQFNGLTNFQRIYLLNFLLYLINVSITHQINLGFGY